jgi:hypothetical protein
MRGRWDTRDFEKKAQQRAPHRKEALGCSGSSDPSMDKGPPGAGGDEGGGSRGSEGGIGRSGRVQSSCEAVRGALNGVLNQGGGGMG